MKNRWRWTQLTASIRCCFSRLPPPSLEVLSWAMNQLIWRNGGEDLKRRRYGKLASRTPAMLRLFIDNLWSWEHSGGICFPMLWWHYTYGISSSPRIVHRYRSHVKRYTQMPLAVVMAPTQSSLVALLMRSCVLSPSISQRGVPLVSLMAKYAECRDRNSHGTWVGDKRSSR